MDLSTIQRVKTHMMKVPSDADTLIANLITSTSTLFEKYLRRHTQQVARTEYFDVGSACRSVFLYGVPITTVTSVYNDCEREYGASTLIDTDDYGYTARTGELFFDYYLEPGNQALKVTYTGGMATTTALFVEAFPDIAYACDLQVAESFRRRGQGGVTSINTDGGSTAYVGHHRMLDGVREILDGYALRVGV